MKPFLRNIRFPLVLLGTAGIIFIAAVSFRVARFSDRHLRQNLLHHARMAALSIELHDLKALSGTPEDVHTPAYRQIKKRLSLIRAVHPDYRFVYLMTRTPSGKLIFLVDSEPDDSENCSPPGQTYPEASEQFTRVFTVENETVEGPIEDRWGVWVSSAVRLPEASFSNAPIVLGIDVDAARWRINVLSFALIPTGLVLIAGLLVLLVLWLQHSRRDLRTRQLKLSQSENRFRQIAEQSRTFVWEIDPSGLYTYVSPVVKSVFGYQPDELIGKLHFYDLHPRKNRDSFKQDMLRAMAEKKELLNLENPARARDGKHIWISTNGSPILDADGKMIGYRGSDVDITERKTTEIALHENRDFLERLLNTIPIPVYYKDKDGRYLKFNQAFEAFFDATRETLVGKTTYDINPPDLAAVSQVKDAELLKRGGRQSYESSVMDARGMRHDAVFFKACLTSPEGQIRGLIGTFLDITERKQSEENTRRLLEETRQAHNALLGILEDQQQAEADAKRLATAIEQADETIVITNADGQIEYVNPAFETVTGYTREEAVGENPRILQSGQHDASFYHHLWETLVIGETWRGRFINKRKDGSLFTEEAVISPVLDNARHITHFVAVKRDITENLQLSEQIQQSQKMDSIGRLAGGIAHDFNNMLTVILAQVQMALDDESVHSSLHNRLSEIQKAASRSADLTQQLLAFARKQTVSPRRLDLNRAVKGTLKMLQRLIGEDIRLVWNPQEPSSIIKIDPGQLDQILANLCINARDAIRGGGTVTIETCTTAIDAPYCETHPTARPGDYACLTVQDTGCGMEPDTLSQIFEPFFTTKELGQGTGLGLSTVYGIIQQNNGFIEAKSTPGHGSTFRVFLPCLSAEAEPYPAEQPPPTGNETILVAEDEPAILSATVQMLKSLGYTVLPAQTSNEALRVVRDSSDTIHLLLTDVVMPGINGWSLSREILRKRPGIRCLFMSGYTADMIARNGMIDEGVEFIQKPFIRRTLAEKIRAILDAAE